MPARTVEVEPVHSGANPLRVVEVRGRPLLVAGHFSGERAMRLSVHVFDAEGWWAARHDFRDPETGSESLPRRVGSALAMSEAEAASLVDPFLAGCRSRLREQGPLPSQRAPLHVIALRLAVLAFAAPVFAVLAPLENARRVRTLRRMRQGS